MNGNAASTNSKSSTGPAWVRHPLLRLMLYACLFACISGFVTFTIVRLRVSFQNERHLAQQQTTIDQLRRDHELLIRSTEERFGLLEQTVWGDLDPKLREALRRSAQTTSKPEAWSVNRDRELRAKLIALERRLWLLEVER